MDDLGVPKQPYVWDNKEVGGSALSEAYDFAE